MVGGIVADESLVAEGVNEELAAAGKIVDVEKPAPERSDTDFKASWASFLARMRWQRDMLNRRLRLGMR